MRKTCLICGKEFNAPPSGAQTCSRKCANRLKSRSHTGVSRGSWHQNPHAVARNLPRLQAQAAANLERISNNPANQRGPNHHAAAKWVLQDPDGQLWHIINLRDWSRTHAHLFGLDDGEHGAELVSAGIRQVKQYMLGRRKTPAPAYKGWTLVSWSEPLDRR